MAQENPFSAGEQALGYLYQLRYALFKIFLLPENSVCCIEKDDDIDYSDPDEGRILASLKHKAPGEALTDLSPDFWKSVRIWLRYYVSNYNTISSTSFFLCTTGRVAPGSLLSAFLPNTEKPPALAEQLYEILKRSESKTINKITALLEQLDKGSWPDFFQRITIFDSQERIENIPELIIKEKFRPIRPQFRIPVFERLEGWWNGVCVDYLTGKRTEPIRGLEVTEKLGSISDQFRDDNLPIDFANSTPEDGVHPETDERYFVKQLRAIGLRSDRIRRAILDYYRAFQQRGSWLREYAELSGELEDYDNRLVDEWARLKEIIFEELNENSADEVLKETGRKLLNQLSTISNPNLRIRSGVTATFVTMGSYHLLANDKTPKVHWHPRFEERIEEIFRGKAI